MRTAEGCAAAARGIPRVPDPCGLAFSLQLVIGELGTHWETPPVYAIVKGIPGLPLGVRVRHVKPLPFRFAGGDYRTATCQAIRRVGAMGDAA